MENFGNIYYEQFEDNLDDNEQIKSPSMYMSIETEETQPFIASQDRNLSDTKKFNSIDLSDNHFKDSWKLGQYSSNNVYRDINNDLEDSIDIMRNNIHKITERENKLTDIDEKAENLLDGSIKFNSQATKLKYKMITKYVCNFLAILLLIIFIITLITILSNY